MTYRKQYLTVIVTEIIDIGNVEHITYGIFQGSVLDGSLIVSQSSVIYKYEPNFTNRVFLARSPFPISFDYDFERDILYWSDLKTRQVQAIEPSSLQTRIILTRQNDWMPNSIALDPFNQKLYVLDSFSGTVNIFDLMMNNHATVIGVNVVDAVRIDIDPYAGYLFVLDSYQVSTSSWINYLGRKFLSLSLIRLKLFLYLQNKSLICFFLLYVDYIFSFIHDNIIFHYIYNLLCFKLEQRFCLLIL
jgi:DNA-binding beta-propeller fold protein YncE